MSQRAEFLRDKIRIKHGQGENIIDLYQDLKRFSNDLSLWQKTFIAVENVMHQPDVGYGELTLLCDYYGCNKGSLTKSGKHHPYYPMPPHTYTEVYEALFSPQRNTVRYVFECGVGTDNQESHGHFANGYKPGASLRVWRDYFPNAEVWGADIDRRALVTEERIHTAWMDQTSPAAIHDFFKNTGVEAFDIMIDDGLHTLTAAYCLFDNAESYLAKGGLYIIEDLSPQNISNFQQHMLHKKRFISKYFVMETPECWANNLIIIKKQY